MKNKKFLVILLAAFVLLLVPACGSGEKSYVLDEKRFFLVMTNMQYYPEQYLGANVEYDCFTYALTDVSGKQYTCGVRKCSSGYGCTCGKDTVIGFLLNYDGTLPAPKNQSADNNDKTWVHLKGKLHGAEKTTIPVYAVLPDGSQDTSTVENIVFLSFDVEECTEIENTEGLHYYVTK